MQLVMPCAPIDGLHGDGNTLERDADIECLRTRLSRRTGAVATRTDRSGKPAPLRAERTISRRIFQIVHNANSFFFSRRPSLCN
jgi:hypothetical protein